MSTVRLEPFFLESSAGRIFVLLHRAHDSDRCAILVPPFAEEMNKCRPQMATTAQLLASHGCSALIVDLYGTGDSEGDFNDASWSCWVQDVVCAVEWARSNGFIVDALLGARLGCSLAAESVAKAGLRVSKTVFWQPIESGEQHMNGFLRYGVAASMIKSESGGSVEDLKQRLGNGETLEIAGYPLAPTLWSDVRRVRLADCLGSFLGELVILEVGPIANSERSTVGVRVASLAKEHGLPARTQSLRGEQFWASTDIVVNAEFCRSTVQAIADGQR